MQFWTENGLLENSAACPGATHMGCKHPKGLHLATKYTSTGDHCNVDSISLVSAERTQPADPQDCVVTQNTPAVNPVIPSATTATITPRCKLVSSVGLQKIHCAQRFIDRFNWEDDEKMPMLSTSEGLLLAQ